MFFSSPASGQEDQSLSLDRLEQALKSETNIHTLASYAVQNNPSILAAREQWSKTIEQYQTATALPDPQLMATYFPTPIETRLGPQDWNVSLTQAIPYPGKLSSKGKMVQAEAEISRLNLDKTIRDVSVAVRQSFHELLYIQQAITISRHTMDLLEHLQAVVENAHGLERATMMDVMKAQSQVAQLRYDMLLLDELEETEKTQLNSLLNREPTSPLGPVSPISVPELHISANELFRIAEQNQDEIQIAQARIAKAEAGRDLAQAKFLPDFKIGIFYAEIGEPDVTTPPAEAGQDALGVRAGFSIPLWFGKNAGSNRAAKAEVRRFRAMKQNRVNMSRANIQKALFRLNNAKRLFTLYKDQLIPQAAQAMKTAETWFQEGQASFTDFLEATSTWYNFQLSLARAQADAGKYLARLEQLTGTTLTGQISQDKEGTP